MAFNRLGHFRTQIVIRVLLLLATIYGFLHATVLNQGYVISASVLALLLLWQVYSLIKMVERHYQQLAKYVLALKSNDGAQTFQRLTNDPSFSEFGLALSQLAEHFKTARHSLEEQTLLLTTVLQHSDAAILAFNQQGKISLCNKAFQQLVLFKKLHSFEQLASCQPLLAEHIRQLGQQGNGILHLDIDNEAFSLMVRVTQASIKGNKVSLVVVQNIKQELAQQEAKSWQQLIRVLTHEMANSITPIASLANSAQLMIADEIKVEGEDLTDLSYSLATIDRRSQGLLNFIDSYRDLSQLPLPEMSVVDLSILFNNTVKLLQHKLTDISVTIIIEPNRLKINADKVQLEQVMINLVLNAIEALAEHPQPQIILSASLSSRGRTLLKVSDNGCGMIATVQQKLFLPFFTTKSNGTGIGLALSKQIIGRHGGHISVRSTLDQGTTMAITMY